MKKITENLKNGILLISHALTHLHSVNISVSFRTGSLYENEHNKGISHLIEHLFFRQLSDLSQDELYLKMQKIGAEINGITYADYVTFNITVVSKYFSQALDLMLKYFDDFEWKYSAVAQEREVVLRQIETAGGSYENWIDSYYFKNTRYAVPIMGTVESVSALTVDEIHRWKKEYFTTQNACVVITGNFTDDDYSLLKIRLNSIEKHGELKERIIEFPENFGRRNYQNYLTVDDSESELSEVVMFFDIGGEFNYESISLVRSIIGDGCGSKLSMAMREKCSLTDDIFSRLLSYCGFYRLCFSYTVKNEKLIQSLSVLFDVIKKMKSGITENEYLSSIAFFTDNQIMNLDDCRVLNDEYLLSDFVLNILPSEPMEKSQMYENLRIEDLVKTANEIFVKDNLSFLIETSLNKDDIGEVLENLISAL